MLQKQETQAVGAVLGSEMHFAASSSDASEDALSPSFRQDFDDLRILRTHWGIDDLTSLRRLGEDAAGIISDMVFRRCVEHLCRRPRLVAKLLAEIAAERSIRVEVEDKLWRYCGLSGEALEATGGDRF